MELNTQQLKEILNKDHPSRKYFLGVFPRDRLPRVKYPSSFIINTQNSNQEGEHWLALFFDKDKNVDFFDSYGNPPNFFILENYLIQNSSKISFNSKQLQSFSSKICGYYCVLFIFYRSRGIPLSKFIEKFSKNQLINDFVLLNSINQHLV